jgi:hypothetical protein
LIGYLVLVAIGSLWWAANLGAVPAYGDTSQYWELADSLRVDRYRTLFYPLLLRGLQRLARALNARRELLAYLLQTAAALLSAGYLGRALWDVTATTKRFASLTRLSPLARRLVIGISAVIVFTEPLVNHFALSVMTDSLAASFTTAGAAALVRIAVLRDTRPRSAILGGAAIAAAGFMRAEKIAVFALVIALTIAILLVGRRRITQLRQTLSERQRLTAIALLMTLLVGPTAAGLALNRATQKADYGWPPLTPGVRLFVRTAWPRLADIRPLLSAQAQAVVSRQDAERFDANYNEYLRLVPRLRQRAGGTDELVTEISLVALRHRGVDIAIATAVDALRYTLPMIAYPADLMLRARSASWWTESRMSMAHPALTRAYLVLATAFLVLMQLPLLTAALGHGRSGDPRVVFAAVLVGGVAVVNGVLYAMGNGLQNVRYALPAYVLVYVMIVWANAAWLVSSGGRR